MVEIKLVLLFIFCIVSSAVFLICVIRSKVNPCGNPPCLIVPVTADMENIEIIVREVILKAAVNYKAVRFILLDYGADKEQFFIFDKAVNGMVDYCIVKSERLAIFNEKL